MGFTAVIAIPILLFVTWGAVARGATRLGVFELDLVLAAVFGFIAVLMGSTGTNLGIELTDTGVVRYWTTGVSRDVIWRAEYPWESLSMPGKGLSGTWYYSDDEPFLLAGNQADAIEADSRCRRTGTRAPADMRFHPGG